MSQLKNKRYEGLIEILPVLLHDLVLYLILLNHFTETDKSQMKISDLLFNQNKNDHIKALNDKFQSKHSCSW